MAPRKQKKDQTPAVETNPLEQLKQGLISEFKLTAEQVDTFINSMGITSADDMSLVTEADLRAAGILPIPARRIVAKYATIAVSAPTGIPAKPTTAMADDPAIANQLGLNPMMLAMALGGGGDLGALFGLIKIEELLGMYDPEEPDNLAANLLQRRFGEQPVILFEKGSRKVMVSETADYIRDLRRGRKAASSLTIGSQTYRLYKVGVIPMDFVDEDPMAPRQPLWNGRSDQFDGVDYNDIPKKVRQLIRIAMNMKLFDPAIAADRNEVMRLARQGYDALAAFYTKASLRFDELSAAHKLPALTVQLGATSGGISDGDDDEVGGRSTAGSFRRGGGDDSTW